MTLSVALPLRAHLADLPQKPVTPIDADALVRELITHAGILPDTTADGCRVVMVALPAHLLAALSAYVAPPTPEALPLLEMMGRA